MTPGARLTLILCAIFLYIPIVALVVFSFDASGLMAFPLGEMTFRWYFDLARNSEMQEGLLVSFLVAQPVAVLATCLGLCAALGLTANDLRYRAGLGVLLIVPFLVPKAVLAMAQTMLLSRFGVPRGLFNLIGAEALITLPFALVILFSVLARLDPRLEEAARDLGATPMQAFWRITLPRLRSGLIVSYSLCVIFSLADLTLSTYLAGSTQPLSVIVASAFKTKLSPDLNALQVVMLALTAAIAGATAIGRRQLGNARSRAATADTRKRNAADTAKTGEDTSLSELDPARFRRFRRASLVQKGSDV